MRFENAKRFLHIGSNVKLQPYRMAKGVRMGRRWRRPLPWIGRFACNHTVWREVLDTHPWATTWGSPYSGKFRTAVGETCGLPLRKVTSAPYGERRSNGSSKLLPYHRFERKGYSHTVWREAPIYSASGIRYIFASAKM